MTLPVLLEDARLRLPNVTLEMLETRDLTSPDVFFPKLGPKSWRDGRGLCPLANDDVLSDRIASLLAAPTQQQAALVTRMAAEGAPLWLYLMPWKDMTAWSEARVHVTEDAAHVTSAAHRGETFEGWKAEVVGYARDIADAVDKRSLDIDVAFKFDGTVRLLEVNPATLL